MPATGGSSRSWPTRDSSRGAACGTSASPARRADPRRGRHRRAAAAGHRVAGRARRVHQGARRGRPGPGRSSPGSPRWADPRSASRRRSSSTCTCSPSRDRRPGCRPRLVRRPGSRSPPRSSITHNDSATSRRRAVTRGSWPCRPGPAPGPRRQAGHGHHRGRRQMRHPARGEDGGGDRGRVRRLAGEHLVEQRAQRVHVVRGPGERGLGMRRQARPRLAGAHHDRPSRGAGVPAPAARPPVPAPVSRRRCPVRWSRPRQYARRGGQAEVDDLDAGRGDHDVARGQVAMHHPPAMGHGQHVRRGGRDPHRLRPVQRAVGEHLGERHPGQQFQHHVRDHRAVRERRLAVLEHPGHARVPEPIGDQRLTPHVIARRRVVGQARREHLDRQLAAPAGIDGRIDGRDAALADGADQHVSPEDGGAHRKSRHDGALFRIGHRVTSHHRKAKGENHSRSCAGHRGLLREDPYTPGTGPGCRRDRAGRSPRVAGARTGWDA